MKTYTSKIDKPLLVIQYDDDAESPREWDNLGYFITSEKRLHSPDRNESLIAIVKEGGEVSHNSAEHIEFIKNNYTDEKILAIYPICRYEHSGISYFLGTTSGFDYSNCGFYIVTDKTLKNMPEKKKEWERIVKNELKTYNSWINGENYRFTLYDKNGEIADSCSGFYSVDNIREHLPDEFKNENLQDYLQ